MAQRSAGEEGGSHWGAQGCQPCWRFWPQSLIACSRVNFALSGPLRRYGRLKGLGLPDRYRLFFRPFEAEGRRLLLILWLGFPRKDGDRNDGYAVFSRLVQRGELPEDWESLQRELDAG